MCIDRLDVDRDIGLTVAASEGEAGYGIILVPEILLVFKEFWCHNTASIHVPP